MLPLLLAATLSACPLVQQAAPDPRQAAAAQTNAAAAEIRHAEDLLEQGDFAAAEPALQHLAEQNPKDAHILFDLGFTAEHNGHNAAATDAYTAAIAADGALAEPRVALGLLEVREGHTEEGHGQLQKAANLPSITPGIKARALRALARLDQATHADVARTELADAIQLNGEQPGDAELTASLSASAGNLNDAETSFRSALAADPNDLEALAGLAGLLERQGKLSAADALLTPALTAHPNDPRLVAQTASLYAAEDKSTEALALLRSLRATDPAAEKNPNLTRLYAHLLLVSGDAAQAEPLYRSLSAASQADPSLLDDLGSTLVREGKFADAEGAFAKAVAQRETFHDDAAWGDAAGHLAFAASRNHQPAVVLQALQARATVLPNSAATLFLEATARDTLHQRKEAARAYRAFLAAADGKLPDEEFEARHRLIALEHEH